MKDRDCAEFLRWALPRAGLRWDGYRNVRGQVCKRIRRRCARLAIADWTAYRAWLDAHPEEWDVLEKLCAVVISRFYRDVALWDALRDDVLPRLAQAALAAGDGELRCWSIGCASGEEPYTLSLLWDLVLRARYPGLSLRVVATDSGEAVLARAGAGVYAAGTLRDLPRGWLEAGFERQGERFRLRERFRDAVELRQQDVRRALPHERFRLVLCRNVVLTYFGEALRLETLARISSRLEVGGAFVVGRLEQRVDAPGLELWQAPGIYRRGPSG
jgi:chemotaxis protein methyltransferase CheR